MKLILILAKFMEMYVHAYNFFKIMLPAVIWSILMLLLDLKLEQGINRAFALIVFAILIMGAFYEMIDYSLNNENDV